MQNKTWSYWERADYPQTQDLIVVGGGFTGLSVAYHAKQKNPDWRVLLLERHPIAEGASTKNAGFACYGTLGEILSDIEMMGESAAFSLVQSRLSGLAYLRELLGDQDLELEAYGGTELFFESEEEKWIRAQHIMESVNSSLGLDYDLFKINDHHHNFKGLIASVYSAREAQINPLKAVLKLERMALESGIKILKGVEVRSYLKSGDWTLESNAGQWPAQRVVFCTNAFGIPGREADIIPARNQVLITKPFKHNIPLGNYHVKEGYIYFRTVGDRLLIGGARHLDNERETTAELGFNSFLLDRLGQFLNEELQLQGKWELEEQWSGIIATGHSKEPIVEELADGLWYCGRFGGMGVALSTLTGKNMAEGLE